jgi:integrase-like protein
VRQCILRTEVACPQRIRRFVLFHDNCHSYEMSPREFETFWSRLVAEGNVSAPTWNQAAFPIRKEALGTRLP